MVQILFKAFLISAMCTLLFAIWMFQEGSAPIAAEVTPTILLSVANEAEMVEVVFQEEVSQGISPIFTEEVQFWEDKIVKWSGEWGLDPNLVATVMQIESCGDPTVISRSGALGLFQVMPFHFSTDEDAFKPRINAARGLAYLSSGLDIANGQADLALAGYNGGHDVIDWDPEFWPEETKDYVYYGSRIYQDAHDGVEVSEVLTEWYNQKGYSMCLWASEVQLSMKNGTE